RISFRYIYEDFNRARYRSVCTGGVPAARKYTATVLVLLAISLVLISGSSIYLAVTVSKAWLCILTIPIALLFFVVRGLIKPKNEFGSPAAWEHDPMSRAD